MHIPKNERKKLMIGVKNILQRQGGLKDTCMVNILQIRPTKS